MSYVRRYRRTLGVIALLALTARLAVAIAMSASMSAGVFAGMPDILGPMPMCTTLVSGTAGVEPGSGGDPAPEPIDHCPVCTLLAAFALAIAALLVGIAVLRPAACRLQLPLAGQLAFHAGLGLLRSRGPPVAA